jgi:peptidylprolyl isomerase/FKBP-type peptidyl-prolyl cis-trans isomerase FklB
MRTLKFACVGLALGLALGAGAASADPVATEPASDNGAFLARNASAPGVVVVPGLQYKVLKSGPANGPHPTRADTVAVRYEGQFVNGKVFDSSKDEPDGVVKFPLGKLISGWVIGVQLMRPGDVWMLYVPPQLAYGASGKGPIPPGSTLVFKIELVGVEPPAPAKP